MCITLTEALTRIIVFIANLAFLLVGVVLLSLGILYKVRFTHYTDAIPSDYEAVKHVPTIAIVVGSIIFVIAFLGCCGTLRSNTCMLTTYASILFVIFLIQVGLGVFGLIQIKNDTDLKSKVDKQITDLFQRYKQNDDVTGVVDLIQKNLQCCGTYSPLSWGLSIPDSCYEKDAHTPFAEGCSTAMYDYISSSVKIIAIVALAISVTEIVGAVLALGLSNCIKSNSRKAGYTY